MNSSFYMGAVAAYQQTQSLTIQGNNIANVNTYGFKTEKGRFAPLMYRNLKAAEERELPTGHGACLWTSATDFREGGYIDTGRRYDYAIQGSGFFALADLEHDEVSLTRCGDFSKARLARPTGEVDESGRPIEDVGWYLTDGHGRFVLDDMGAVIEITEENDDRLPVGVFDYMNYNGMEHIDLTRFRAVEKNGGLQMGKGVLQQGKLEASNVELSDEISKVIETQRAYSMALKLVQTSDEIETTINGLRG